MRERVHRLCARGHHGPLHSSGLFMESPMWWCSSPASFRGPPPPGRRVARSNSREHREEPALGGPRPILPDEDLLEAQPTRMPRSLRPPLGRERPSGGALRPPVLPHSPRYFAGRQCGSAFQTGQSTLATLRLSTRPPNSNESGTHTHTGARSMENSGRGWEHRRTRTGAPDTARVTFRTCTSALALKHLFGVLGAAHTGACACHGWH